MPAAGKRPPAAGAKPPKRKERGTCPENSRGVRPNLRQTRAEGANRGRRKLARRRWRPPGSPSPAASRRARSSPQLAYGPSCSTSVAVSRKTRLRSRPLKTPRGHRAAPGLPSGPFPYTKEALPRISRAGAARPRAAPVRYREASPESGESRERAPDELARPTHVLDSPPAPSEGPGAPARPTFSNGPAGRELRSHPRSLRRRTSTGRGPTTSRRSSATA